MQSPKDEYNKKANLHFLPFAYLHFLPFVLFFLFSTFIPISVPTFPFSFGNLYKTSTSIDFKSQTTFTHFQFGSKMASIHINVVSKDKEKEKERDELAIAIDNGSSQRVADLFIQNPSLFRRPLKPWGIFPLVCSF